MMRRLVLLWNLESQPDVRLRQMWPPPMPGKMHPVVTSRFQGLLDKGNQRVCECFACVAPSKSLFFLDNFQGILGNGLFFCGTATLGSDLSDDLRFPKWGYGVPLNHPFKNLLYINQSFFGFPIVSRPEKWGSPIYGTPHETLFIRIWPKSPSVQLQRSNAVHITNGRQVRSIFGQSRRLPASKSHIAEETAAKLWWDRCWDLSAKPVFV